MADEMVFDLDPNIIGPKSKKQYDFMHSEADITVFGGAAGCYVATTEFLTPIGWKQFSDYQEGDLVAQYNDKDNKISFVKPSEFIKLPCESVKRIHARGLDFQLSPEHRVPYWNDGWPDVKVISFEKMLERHSKSRTKGFTGKIRTCFNVDNQGIDWNEGDIRLQVAVQADGRIVREGKDNYTQMRFKKERKYVRLIEMCNKFNLRFKDNGRGKDEYYDVIVWPKTKEKIFKDHWYQCSQEQLSWIADEVAYWDSNIVKNDKTETVRYSSVYKENVDFMQYAFHATGRNTSIVKREAHDNHRACYNLNATYSGKGFRAFANKDGKVPVVDMQTPDGYKYCFTVDSGFLVVRQNNKIFVSGNSGKSIIGVMDFLKNVQYPTFRGCMVRRTTPQLKGPGGLQEKAEQLFKLLDPKVRWRDKEHHFLFSNGAKIYLRHFENLTDKDNYQG